MSSDAEVDELQAWVAIRRVQNRYADVVTRRAWTELADVLSPDCALILDLADRQLTHTGPTDIGTFISAQLEQFSFFQFVILNTVMEIDASAGRARARMWMQETRQAVADGRRSDIYGVYHDDMARDAEGRWWFDRRRYRSLARPAADGAGADLDVFPMEIEPLDR